MGFVVVPSSQLAGCKLVARKPLVSHKSRAASAPRRPRTPVKTHALFGGGGGGSKAKAGSAYICKDCGYIEADFPRAVANNPKYKCPVCNAPQRRFSPYNQPVSRNVNSTATRKSRKAELQDDSGAAGGPNPLVLVGAGVGILLALYVGLNAAV